MPTWGPAATAGSGTEVLVVVPGGRGGLLGTAGGKGREPILIGYFPCHGAAERVAVNEHCLADETAEAFRLAALSSRPEEGYEPGPYFVVEVWRKETMGPHRGF